jgi:hypothetical protein
MLTSTMGVMLLSAAVAASDLAPGVGADEPPAVAEPDGEDEPVEERLYPGRVAPWSKTAPPAMSRAMFLVPSDSTARP